MRNPKQETGISWLKRLRSFFRRDKAVTEKTKTEVTNKTWDNRAFSISLVTGLAFLAITAILLVAKKDQPINPSTAAVGVFALIGAMLARRGKTSLGVGLLLIGLYAGGISSAMTTSGGGIAIASVLMVITLGITSATMPTSLANRVNILALFVAAIPVLLDLFEPFSRAQNSSPIASVVLAIIVAIAYAVVVVRRFNTYNLRTKLLIAFGAVTVLPLISLGYYSNIQLSNALYESTQVELGQFANQTASQVDTFVENQLSAVNRESQNPLFIQYLSLPSTQRTGSATEASVKEILTLFAHQDKVFINAYTLLDDKGTIVLNITNRDEKNNNPTQFFKQAITLRTATVSGPLIDQKTGQASLYFSAPVKNMAGVLLGVLVVEYNANVIESVVDSLTSSTQSRHILFQIIDKDNFVRIADTDTAHPELRYTSFKDFTPTQVAALQKLGLLLPQNALVIESEALAGLENLAQSPFFTTIADKTLQIKNLNSGAQLKSVNWLALVTQSEAVVLTPLIEQRRITTIIFIFLLVLVTLAAFGLSQLLASPILRLAATAQKIAAGDLSLQSDIESNDEIGTLAGAFNEMTRQSRALIESLEQRSKALATSSEVSRRISTILDQQELVTEVVKQVQSAFNYYHAHIYILDENTQELIMAGGTGEAGKAMLARGHKISVGKGLVGRAAQNNVTVLVADVSNDPQWLPNPLLPDTKSEVAVPIAIAERVLGVLDVQHNVAGTLKQEDVDVLQSIANQVAFAVRNARSYSEVQAKADRESLITSIGQKIQGTITVESALQVAIREIGRALNGAKTQIVLNENSSADQPQPSDADAITLKS